VKKILLIDDSAFMRLAIKKLFQEKDHQFIECYDAAKAVALFQSSRPDLVLLDIVMPKVRGVQILQQIKQEDPSAKIIMITAVGRESIVEQCKKLGVSDYIIKPFDDDEVRAAVERCLG
jgi:two-component system, chemotaxis family, chemotaxis protein CheY